MPRLPTISADRVENDPEQAQRFVRNDMRALRDKLDRVPIIPPDGVMYAPGTALSAGNNTITHKLGRVPKGWIVTRSSGAAAQLYEVSKDDKVIVLNSTGTPTVEVWFF